MKPVPLALFVLSAVALPLASRAAPEKPARVSACPNPLPHEPLVVYEVSGGTLVGQVDQFVSVYADGTARLSSSLGSGPGFAWTSYIGDAAAAELHASLIAAGALAQCDQDTTWNDVPLSTLTVLRSPTKQSGATFSWWVAEGDVQAIEALLLDFVAANFPAPPSGGGS